MIDERDVIELKQRLSNLESLIQGEQAIDGRPGLLTVLREIRSALFGNAENPGGLIKTVREHEEWKWRVLGGAAVLGTVAGVASQLVMKLFTSN